MYIISPCSDNSIPDNTWLQKTATKPVVRLTRGTISPIRNTSEIHVTHAYKKKDMDLDILRLPGTVHLGLQPADTKTIMALWFDNMSRNYTPPPDPAKRVLDLETTKGMQVHLRLDQVVIWM